MIERGIDLDLNCSPWVDNDASIMDELRQTMLQHEHVFREQVGELHRLYWTQKNLMHELQWKESDVYTPYSSEKLQMVDLTGEESKSDSGDFENNFLSENDSIPVWMRPNFDSREGSSLNNGHIRNAPNLIDLEKPPILESDEGEGIVCFSGLNNLSNNSNLERPSAYNDTLVELPPDKRIQIDLNIAQEQDEPIKDSPDSIQHPVPSPCVTPSVAHPHNLSSFNSPQKESESVNISSITHQPNPAALNAAQNPSETNQRKINDRPSNNYKHDEINLNASIGSTDLQATTVTDFREKQETDFGASEEDTVSSHAITNNENTEGENEKSETNGVITDETITMAAMTLVSISFDDKNEETDEPEYSLDSFVRETLNLVEETGDDATWTPKNATWSRESDKCSINLRRGRGLRDFQRDVLPGMVSLSRHEICEDLHAIGYELRKNRSRRNSGGEEWAPPVRNRRPRRQCVGRRR